MAASTDTHNKTVEKTWRRRGLFAAAAALVAGVVSRVTEQRVEAGTDGDVVLGADNATASQTAVFCTTSVNAFKGVCQATDGGGLLGICRAGNFGTGVSGVGSQFGIFGDVQNPTGAAPETAGVIGRNAATTPGSIGVLGVIPPASNANAIGMYGLNYSTYTGPGPGAGGFAIYGLSANGHGLVGATAAAGAAAVVGASNGVGGAYAAAFYGPVVVSGAFTVVGGPKSAAVPHPDGTHRRLYCMESPESWFEDFGRGQLACGQADVTIDPDFAAVVDLNDYHVFLTGYDGQSDLSVCDRTPSGFRVRATGGAGNGDFSWRVVAKRKDVPAPRFETVEVPPEPQLPNIPEPPAPPEPPDFRPRVGAHPRG